MEQEVMMIWVLGWAIVIAAGVMALAAFLMAEYDEKPFKKRDKRQ